MLSEAEQERLFAWAAQFGPCDHAERDLVLAYPPPRRGPWMIPMVERCRYCDDERPTAIMHSCI